VRSAIVIGLPADEGLERIHAIVDAPTVVDDDDLERMLRDTFPDVPMPASWSRRSGPLRDNAGKAQRRRIRAELLGGGPRADD